MASQADEPPVPGDDGFLQCVRDLYRADQIPRNEWLAQVEQHRQALEANPQPDGEQLAIDTLLNELDARELAIDPTAIHQDLPAGSVPCRYPTHHGADWVNDAGRPVCGICHPPATR